MLDYATVIVCNHWLIISDLQISLGPSNSSLHLAKLSLPTSDVTARTKKTMEVIVISNVTKIKLINEKFQGLSSASEPEGNDAIKGGFWGGRSEHLLKVTVQVAQGQTHTQRNPAEILQNIKKQESGSAFQGKFQTRNLLCKGAKSRNVFTTWTASKKNIIYAEIGSSSGSPEVSQPQGVVQSATAVMDHQLHLLKKMLRLIYCFHFYFPVHAVKF